MNTPGTEHLAGAPRALGPEQAAARRRAARLRIAGTLILVLAIAGAGLRYWIRTRSASPTLEELMPGSNEARSRQVGILIGSFGVSLLEAWEYFRRPGTEAIVIVALGALVAFGCFRVATLLEEYSAEP